MRISKQSEYYADFTCSDCGLRFSLPVNRIPRRKYWFSPCCIAKVTQSSYGYRDSERLVCSECGTDYLWETDAYHLTDEKLEEIGAACCLCLAPLKLKSD
jgi:hypothetical protein